MKRTALLSRSPFPHLHIRDLPAFPAPGHAFPHTHSKLSVLPFLLVRDRKRSLNPDSGRPGGRLQTPSNLPANSPAHGSELAGGRRQEHSPSPWWKGAALQNTPDVAAYAPSPSPAHLPPSPQLCQVGGVGQRRKAVGGPRLLGLGPASTLPWLPGGAGAAELARGQILRPELGSLPCPGEAACVRGPSMEGHGLSRVCRHCDVWG